LTKLFHMRIWKNSPKGAALASLHSYPAANVRNSGICSRSPSPADWVTRSRPIRTHLHCSSHARPSLLSASSFSPNAPVQRTSLGSVAGENIGAGEAEMGECAQREVQHDPTMIEELLKFCSCGCRGRAAQSRNARGLRSHVGGKIYWPVTFL